MLILSIVFCLLLSLLVAGLQYRSDRKRAIPYPLLTAALRGTLVLLVLLLVVSPRIRQRKTETQKPLIALIQDHSKSVGNALGKDQGTYQRNLSELVRKLSKDYKVVLRNLDGPTAADSLNRYPSQTTDLSTAINQTTDLYAQQNLSAVILASDGWYNTGSNPQYAELPLNGSFYSIAIGDTAIPADVRIARVYANRTVALNSQWELRADILANRCAGIRQTVSLLNGSGQVVATALVNIDGERFDASVSFSVKADQAGLQQYTLSIPRTGQEQNIANNRANVFVSVIQEKKKVLLLAAAPHPDIKAIEEALKPMEQYALEIKAGNDIPANAEGYACIILHQFPVGGTPLPAGLLSNKSIWFIDGAGTNYAALNNVQAVASFNGGIAPHNAEAVYNQGFNAFVLPANTAAVTDILPPLAVSAADYRLAGGAQSLFNDQAGRPLWAVLPAQHPVAITCGEGIWRWRFYEYKNFRQQTVIDECIRQTINFLTANNNAKPFRTEMLKYEWSNPEHISISAFLYNANNELINQPEAKISIKDSNGTTRSFNFERNGSSYRLDAGALPAGRYTYAASAVLNGKTYTDEGRFMVETTSLEDQESGCNYALMYSLAQQNQGNTVTPATMMSLYDSIARNNNIKPVLNEQIELTDLISWKWLFALILVLAAAEWLLRKYWLAM